MERQQIEDAVHIKVGYGAQTPDGQVTAFNSFPAVKEFVRETGIKSFFAYDKDNTANIVNIKAIYMDRYRESDIEDRLIANKQQGGKSFFFKEYEKERDERLKNELEEAKKQNQNGEEL